jgi:hypothetical protein
VRTSTLTKTTPDDSITLRRIQEMLINGIEIRQGIAPGCRCMSCWAYKANQYFDDADSPDYWQYVDSHFNEFVGNARDHWRQKLGDGWDGWSDT